jgi:type VI secretion system protein ImpG
MGALILSPLEANAMYIDYYKQELRALYDNASEFAKQHPSVAGLLQEPSVDPDVERLLQGVAFLTADVRRKLDQEFPELVQTLIQSICPRYLRPVPSATIMALTPRDNLKQSLRVPAGTMIDSIPIEGTSCRFRTCYDVIVSPIDAGDTHWLDHEHQTAATPWTLVLPMQTRGVGLPSLQLDTLRIHIAGDMANAADLYCLLRQHLRRVVVRQGNQETILPVSAIKPVGFESSEWLLPSSAAESPAFVVLQEYFQFPQKFLFFDIDLRAWRERAEGAQFALHFEFSKPSFAQPTVRKDTFLLYATPAVNLFGLDAEPILHDHTQPRYLVKPSGSAHQGVTLYQVDRVEGRQRGTQDVREYRPFSTYAPGSSQLATFQLSFQEKIQSRDIDTFISFAYAPQERLLDKEIVVAHLTCSNGHLPEKLLPGDIRVPTTSTPALVDFRNITSPSPTRQPNVDGPALWELLAHLSLNYLAIANADNIKNMLFHYLLLGQRDRAQEMVNLKRIEGIQELQVKPGERLFGAAFIRGYEFTVNVRQDHYVSEGDKYLFGTILDYFLGAQAALNCFTRLSFNDVISGENVLWPTRLGTKSTL